MKAMMAPRSPPPLATGDTGASASSSAVTGATITAGLPRSPKAYHSPEGRYEGPALKAMMALRSPPPPPPPPPSRVAAAPPPATPAPMARHEGAHEVLHAPSWNGYIKINTERMPAIWVRGSTPIRGYHRENGWQWCVADEFDWREMPFTDRREMPATP